ncbi:hypothetical protein GN156_14845 [bacterium LRH843]|nr:hypothetical protein [bacterium LRH843]
MTLLAFYVLNNSDETNNMYLIPAGYEGDVLVFYNVKGAPVVEMDGG